MGKTYKIRKRHRRGKARQPLTENRKRGIVSQAWKLVAEGKMTVTQYDELRSNLGEV